MHEVPEEPYKTAGPTVYEFASYELYQSSVEEVIGG